MKYKTLKGLCKYLSQANQQDKIKALENRNVWSIKDFNTKDITEIEAVAQTQRNELTERTAKEILCYFNWWNYEDDKYNLKTINKILFNGSKNEIAQLRHDFINAQNGCWNIDTTLYNINKLVKEQ